MRILVVLSVGALLSACVSQQYYYRVSDGQRSDATPAGAKQVEVDKAVCQGEAAKAALAGQYRMEGYRVMMVERGCMAGKGYVVR
ncbi:Hypothetical protein NGAL_HAMBI2605_59080 [Neorhizobium galegae bv. orientalis]|nr:Hypothetical protein NGAL_HAMBI2605_59080 [Neorhizobium galegae bv. orientalis]